MKTFEESLPKSAIITIDIETLPGEQMPSSSEVQHPGNITKPESIQKWYDENLKAKLEEIWRKEALISHKGRVLCIGYKINDEPTECIYSTCEEDVIEKFDILLSQFETVTFVGKSISFDMMFIYQRALKYGCRNIRKHIRPEFKRDLIDITYLFGQWIDYRYMVSLDNIAKFFGFESSKTDEEDGSKVFDLFVAGKHDVISDYCKRDVDLTYKIYNHIK